MSEPLDALFFLFDRKKRRFRSFVKEISTKIVKIKKKREDAAFF